MAHTYLYLNGEIMPTERAALSPFDVGLLRGYAVFDLLRTVGGTPFLLEEHLQRLHSSAGLLGLRVPISDAEIARIIGELLARNAHTEATVRLLLTGGVSPDGMHFDPDTPTFMIMTHELHSPPAQVYQEGARLTLVEHTREVSEAKTTNYLTKLLNDTRAAEEGALELLYHTDGVITEGASASVFFVRDGQILAPRNHVLHGTIGAFVLDLAREDYEVLAADVTVSEALTSDEVFLTSTTRDVVPIVRIGDHVIGDGAPGPIVRDLMERYRSVVFGA